MFIALSRVIQFGLQNFWRNLGLSLTTVTILVLTLISVNILFVIQMLTAQAVKSVNDAVDVSIYFKPGVSEDSAREVETYLKTFSDVTQTSLLSQDEVLERFKEAHKNEKAVLESLSQLGENPLSSILIIKAATPGAYQKILDALNVPEYQQLIESKTYDDHSEVIQRINLITSRVKFLASATSILFGVIAFLIIFNAIRVAIYSQRTEISIKKLVGATNWFIRGPFLVSGLLFALLSVGITAAIVFVGLRFLDPYIGVLFGTDSFLTKYFISSSIFVFGLQFVAVLVLIGLSSALAMRKHLRV